MSAEVERGYLVLADISGYTGYLAHTELDHANEILADLIGVVVDALVPQGESLFDRNAIAMGVLNPRHDSDSHRSL